MRIILSAVLVVVALLASATFVSSANAHHYAASTANSVWRSTNYGGACGAGTFFHCSRLGSSDCNITTGEHSRKCVGYYIRGPGLFWPTNCKATGNVYHANPDNIVINSNVCWD